VKCCGLGQDRVNFHQNPGRGTAGWADPTPTWPNRAGYSTPCAIMLGSGGGDGAAGTHSRLGSVQRQRFGRAALLWGLFCCVFSFSVSLLFLFSLFAVLLNCPYPDPPVSACFFPFSSAPRRGEGGPRGAFVTGGSRTRTENKSLHSETYNRNRKNRFITGVWQRIYCYALWTHDSNG